MQLQETTTCHTFCVTRQLYTVRVALCRRTAASGQGRCAHATDRESGERRIGRVGSDGERLGLELRFLLGAYAFVCGPPYTYSLPRPAPSIYLSLSSFSFGSLLLPLLFFPLLCSPFLSSALLFRCVLLLPPQVCCQCPLPSTPPPSLVWSVSPAAYPTWRYASRMPRACTRTPRVCVLHLAYATCMHAALHCPLISD